MIARLLVAVPLVFQQGAIRPMQVPHRTTYGDCSPVVSGDNNTITITCQDKKLLEFIRNLVSRIAAKQLDPETVYSKFDEIMKGISDIRDAYAPRRLTDPEKHVLVELMGPFKGNSIDVTCLMGDSESFRYAEDFVAAFRAAGWDAGSNAGVNQAIFNGVPEGVIVKVPSEADTQSPVVQTFGRALATIGIRPVAVISPESKKPFSLVIGRKPSK